MGWQNDLACGEGEMVFADGTFYSGQWQDNSKHGKGTYTFVDGSEYAGQWTNDKMHGTGTLIRSQRKHEENWQDSLGNSKGVSNKSGSVLNVYRGEFENGKRHGIGTLTFGPNGSA